MCEKLEPVFRLSARRGCARESAASHWKTMKHDSQLNQNFTDNETRQRGSEFEQVCCMLCVESTEVMSCTGGREEKTGLLTGGGVRSSTGLFSLTHFNL